MQQAEEQIAEVAERPVADALSPTRRRHSSSFGADGATRRFLTRGRRRRAAPLEETFREEEPRASEIVIADSEDEKVTGANIEESQANGEQCEERQKTYRSRRRVGHRCSVCRQIFPTSQLAVVGADSADFDWLGPMIFRCVNCKMPPGLKEEEKAEFQKLHDTLVREQHQRREWAVVAHRQHNAGRRQVGAVAEATWLHASTAIAKAATTTAASENHVAVDPLKAMPGTTSGVATQRSRAGKRQLSAATPNNTSAPVEESWTAASEMPVKPDDAASDSSSGSSSSYSYSSSEEDQQPVCTADASASAVGAVKDAESTVKETLHPKSAAEPQPSEHCPETGNNVDEKIKLKRKRGRRSDGVAQEPTPEKQTQLRIQAAQAAQQVALMTAFATQLYPAGFGCAPFGCQPLASSALGWPQAQTNWPGAQRMPPLPPPPPPRPPTATLGGQVDFEDI